MRILLWHVHGSWTTAFVQGAHDYVVPVVPGRGPDGRGRARTWDWPSRVRELGPAELAALDYDVVILQRPEELTLTAQWTGRRPGRDVPAVFLEHNTPGGHVPMTRHPLANQSAVPIVHVTHFNRLFWDCGWAPTHVIEHGIIDPGHLYSGQCLRSAVVVNDPVRRGRAVGTDLLPMLAQAAPLDVFGMGTALLGDLGLVGHQLRTFDDLSQAALHRQLARRRVYVHTSRWTSLGLSLLEAMHLGLPVVALATTDVVAAVPPHAGVISTRPEDLVEAIRVFMNDPDHAVAVGSAAREAALARYGLGRFLSDWDELLADVTVR